MPASLAALVDALQALPGVGPKTAQRMATHLLQSDRPAAERLGQSLLGALHRIGHCARCNTFSEEPICGLCLDGGRSEAQLCVVETPTDMLMLEQTGSFQGRYFVLMGRLSPLDGVGPSQLPLPQFLEQARRPGLEEVIIATNFTPEGEATAHALETLLQGQGLSPPLRIARLARGVPAGGELEYVDLGTIAQALRERRPLSPSPESPPLPPKPLSLKQP